jgi:1-acyl-sn-glycerol-3-phosphate acyltransferase
MARLKRGRDRIIDPQGRRRLTRNEKVGIGSVAVLLGVAVVGVIAGVLIDRMLNFDDALDAGGEWDEGGGVHTRWQ